MSTELPESESVISSSNVEVSLLDSSTEMSFTSPSKLSQLLHVPLPQNSKSVTSVITICRKSPHKDIIYKQRDE
jgi:hypothetical protein